MANQRDETGGRPKKDAKEAPEKKGGGKAERLVTSLLVLIAAAVVSGRFAGSVRSPWAEILSGVVVLTPILAVVLFFRAYPHPIRTMHRKMAADKAQMDRETRRKKKKRKY